LYNGERNRPTRVQEKIYKLHLIASKNAPIGHVAIAGESPDGTVVARGFYPLEFAGVLTGDVPGEVRDDWRIYDAALSKEDCVLMRTLSVTQTQHDDALSFMDGFADNNYNLYLRSCVTAALGSLNAAGVSAFEADTFGATPHAIHKAIETKMPIPRP